jgi:thiamine biosynthesis protein ThiI
MMIRIANQLARSLKIQALVTGESLGQVASQTLENLSVINQVATIPILRPLVGFNKDEILEHARLWDTHDTSVLPTADCCTLFADQHPVLRGQISSIEQQEQQFSISDLIQEALESITVWKQSPQ